jgi:hypothetical protein
MDVPLYEVPLTGDGPGTVRMTLQRDATKLALLLSWDDPISKKTPAAADDFLKGVTIELASGNAKNAWEWRAEWERDAAKRPNGAAEERGAGAQKLRALGCWEDGAWRVGFERPLEGEGSRLALAGGPIEVVVTIADWRPGAGRNAKSGTFKLSVPPKP